jgi:rare lipoprotein A
MKRLIRLGRAAAAVLLFLAGTAHAEVASIYGGVYDGRRSLPHNLVVPHSRSGGRKDRHGRPFGTQIRVCHSGCVTVRINDRGPWVRGRDIDLSPAAARAIGLYKTGRVIMSAGL